jgi:hypothetical protein
MNERSHRQAQADSQRDSQAGSRIDDHTGRITGRNTGKFTSMLIDTDKTTDKIPGSSISKIPRSDTVKTAGTVMITGRQSSPKKSGQNHDCNDGHEQAGFPDRTAGKITDTGRQE